MPSYSPNDMMYIMNQNGVAIGQTVWDMVHRILVLLDIASLFPMAEPQPPHADNVITFVDTDGNYIIHCTEGELHNIFTEEELQERLVMYSQEPLPLY